MEVQGMNLFGSNLVIVGGGYGRRMQRENPAEPPQEGGEVR
jgi:hypothetical protein